MTQTQTPTRTLEDFEAQVRSVAIRVAHEQGFCDSGLNDVLRELGLPEKLTYRIPVRVADAVVRVSVRDAQSEDEAREMLRADPQRTLKSLERTTGLTVAQFEVLDAPPQPEPDAGVPLPGQARPAEGTWYAVSTQSGGPNQCRVRNEEGGIPDLYCTRPAGHPADWHVAAGMNAGVLAVFPAQEGDVRSDGLFGSDDYEDEDEDDD